jgi:hypothetical protein
MSDPGKTSHQTAQRYRAMTICMGDGMGAVSTAADNRSDDSTS